MNMEDNFFNVFSGWFNADLVNIDDPQAVEDTADSCAADLVRNIPNIDAVIALLSGMLDAWTPAIIGKFMNAGLIDWLWDEPTELILKHVLRLIIAELRYIRAAQKPFSKVPRRRKRVSCLLLEKP